MHAAARPRLTLAYHAHAPLARSRSRRQLCQRWASATLRQRPTMSCLTFHPPSLATPRKQRAQLTCTAYSHPPPSSTPTSWCAVTGACGVWIPCTLCFPHTRGRACTHTRIHTHAGHGPHPTPATCDPSPSTNHTVTQDVLSLRWTPTTPLSHNLLGTVEGGRWGDGSRCGGAVLLHLRHEGRRSLRRSG